MGELVRFSVQQLLTGYYVGSINSCFDEFMAHASTFEELDVYKTARALSLRIHEIARDFPMEEKYSLNDQIRRSSRSIGAQIAEAWAKRKYPNHFISKLTDADGEQHETRHWVLCALDLRLFNI